MAFKMLDNGDPVLVCDVCGNRLYDPFGDLASGTVVGGDLGDIVIHHATCATDKEMHLPLNKFFALFTIKNGYGDASSDGVTERAILGIPTGESFE